MARGAHVRAAGTGKKKTGSAFDAEFADASNPAWADDIDQVIFRGSVVMEEVVFFHRASRTAPRFIYSQASAINGDNRAA